MKFTPALAFSALAQGGLGQPGLDQAVLKMKAPPSLTPTIKNGTAVDPQDKCPGYRAQNIETTGTGFSAVLSLDGEPCNAYGTDLQQLKFSVEYQSEKRVAVRIEPAKLTAENETFYDLPEEIVHKGKVEDKEHDELKVEYGNDPSFWFKVARKENGEVLFSTENSKIVYENQFIELKTRLPKGHNLYGLGETVDDFKIRPGKVRTIHNADIPDQPDANLYGTHPIYVDQRFNNGKGSAHAVYLRNAHTQEVLIDEEALTWRLLGGSIDLYVFAGDTAKKAVQQYQHVVGMPAMHQYWTLGYHHSRWGIKTPEEMLEIANNFTDNNLPLETMWSDLDYMYQKRDFTQDPDTYSVERFGKTLKALHDSHRHYIPLTDAAIYSGSDDYDTFKSGLQNDVFVKNQDGSIFVGEVWPGPCVFPDWLAFNTPNWWIGELQRFHETVPYDGLWVDMNEVSSFCTAEECSQHYSMPNGPYGTYHDGTVADEPDVNARNLRFPPYAINNAVEPNEMGGKTMPMEAVHSNGIREYDWHNLWGYQMCRASYGAMADEVIPGKRPFIISRSTFAGSGAVAGHWGGDNYARWEYLKWSITQGLSFSIFGIPMFGTDVCGFHDVPSEELCNRWAQLGAFFSFYRGHNDQSDPPQEFYVWDSVADAARKAMEVRYRMLPYMYTLLQQAHDYGDTWLRALTWEFPDDESLADVDTQFMVGGAIMVVPVLEQGKTQVENAAFPRARWYDWYSKEEVKAGTNTVDAPLGHIPVYIRGGNILALQEPRLTTHESRQGEWELLIALDNDGKASGDLYLDDGESLQSPHSWVHFRADERKLEVWSEGHYETPNLSKITVLGDGASPSSIQLDRNDWTRGFSIKL